MQQTLDMKFQAKSSIWSHHCGIVSLNSSIILSASLVTIDQRLIACTVSHVDQVFEPFTIVTIYAPASVQPRREFYYHIMKLPLFSRIHIDSLDGIQVDLQSLESQLPHRILITGDFNYSPSISCRATNSTMQSPFHVAQQKWHNFLLANFNEVTHPSLDNPLPTFRRGTTLSTIDYFFSSLSLSSCVLKSRIEFINPSWTDHALLSVQFKFGSNLHGKGLWRANPYLAANPQFISTLYRSLDWFCSSRLSIPFEMENNFSPFSVETPQLLWDAVKIEVKRVARSFGRKQASWRQLHLSRLQTKRERILSSQLPTNTLHTKLTKTEQLIGNLQTDIAKNQILKAHKHWRENGETSAGYLKRSIVTRSSQRYIPSLQHPIDGRLCTSPEDLQEAAREFYQKLYRSDPINESNISTLLDTIPEDDIIPSNASQSLLTPFKIDDLIEGSSRSPRKSSPGMDGLPYEIMSLLFNHPGISKLAIEVYNDALLKER
ncbi:hypothetical protein G6F43_013025 [Rhizopus delemar]|nr:hypothetical protein G6F43_013025 [Rhizopus delemar]